MAAADAHATPCYEELGGLPLPGEDTFLEGGVPLWGEAESLNCEAAGASFDPAADGLAGGVELSEGG